MIISGCDLGSQVDPSDFNVNPYHMVVLQDITDTADHHTPYRDMPEAENIVLEPDLYRSFFLSAFEHWGDVVSMLVSGNGSILERDISSTFELHVNDDDFIVYEEDEYGVAYDGYLCEIEYLDLVVDGATEYSISEILAGVDAAEPLQLDLKISSLMTISHYYLEQEYIGSSQPFSLYGAISISQEANDDEPKVTGSFDASFGSRLYSTVDSLTYGGKIIARLHVEQFEEVPYSDFIEAVEILVGLVDIAGTPEAVIEWDRAESLLWGPGSTNNVTYRLMVGDNQGEINSRTYPDWQAYLTMFLVDEVTW